MYENQILEKLKNTLVLSVFKSFWASKESEIFPNRIYTRTIIPGPGRFGTSRNPVNNFTVALQGFRYYLTYRPKLIIIGSSARVSPWYSYLKKHGFLGETKLLAIGQNYLNDQQVEQFEKIIIYSKSEVELHKREIQEKYSFIYLPADGDFKSLSAESGDYIFTGGGAGRDFTSLICSIKSLDIKLKIVTFSPDSLNYSGEIPENCQIYWRMPRQNFLQNMAKSKFVVVPLIKGNHPHGHTTIVQALSLGKAVVSTKSASVDDYISNNIEGILVEPGDISGYKNAIQKMYQVDSYRKYCERNVRKKANKLTYVYFKDSLLDVINEII